MAAEQNMTKAIMQAAMEAAKAAIMVIKEAENSVSTAKPIQMMPKTGDLALKQPIFDWKVPDKYQELQNIKIEVEKIMTSSYNTQEND